MTTLSILSFIILAAYTIGMCLYLKKIPSSLSMTAFYLDYKQRILWFAAIWGATFLVAPALIEKTSGMTQCLAFIAAGSLLIVGACPLIPGNEEIDYKLHCIAAILCAVASQLMLLLSDKWWLLLAWVPFIVYAIKKKDKWEQRTFWAEMVCFALIYIYVCNKS